MPAVNERISGITLLDRPDIPQGHERTTEITPALAGALARVAEQMVLREEQDPNGGAFAFNSGPSILAKI